MTTNTTDSHTNHNLPLDCTLLHGTLRMQDVVPLLHAVGQQLSKVNPLDMPDMPEQYAAAIFDEDHDWWSSADCYEIKDALFDFINANAPSGYYFGAHEGDGSDFGFWREDEETDESDETQTYSVQLEERVVYTVVVEASDAESAQEMATSTWLDSVNPSREFVWTGGGVEVVSVGLV